MSVASRVVTPFATYHVGAVAVAQALGSRMSPLATLCSTTAPPPAMSTCAAAHAAGATSATFTDVVVCAASVIDRFATTPSLGTTVKVAGRSASVGFAIVTKPAVVPSAGAGMPGQNHVVVAADGGGAIGCTGAVAVPNTTSAGAGRSRSTARPAASRPPNTRRIGKRRIRRSKLPMSRARPPQRQGRCRGRPRSGSRAPRRGGHERGATASRCASAGRAGS